ncbi:unnamed protein product [Owenia fusiformis]|uniref:Uncharacterized protein n=1 Tax=Owenia fusiformis TaxID=6347 RepID=A0A8J1YB26_OWEFU|nr:unnamed protein product [Owenia fusiformis]
MAVATADTKIRNLESSILFMQSDHAITLKGLHAEIQKLQKKCSEYTFQIAMQTTSSTEFNEDHYIRRVKSLEESLVQRDTNKADLEKQIEKKDRKIAMLEQQLKAQEKRLCDKLKEKDITVQKLNRELEMKTDNIVAITHQLHQMKVVQMRYNESHSKDQQERFSHSPAPPKDGAPSRRRSSLRKSSTTPAGLDIQDISAGRVSSGRKLPVPPDPSPFLHHPKPEVKVELRPSPQVLPPIRNIEEEYLTPRQAYSQTFVRHKSNTQQKNISPINGLSSSDSQEVETLAVDQTSKHKWREENSQSFDYN